MGGALVWYSYTPSVIEGGVRRRREWEHTTMHIELLRLGSWRHGFASSRAAHAHAAAGVGTICAGSCAGGRRCPRTRTTVVITVVVAVVISARCLEIQLQGRHDARQWRAMEEHGQRVHDERVSALQGGHRHSSGARRAIHTVRAEAGVTGCSLPELSRKATRTASFGAQGVAQCQDLRDSAWEEGPTFRCKGVHGIRAGQTHWLEWRISRCLRTAAGAT